MQQDGSLCQVGTDEDIILRPANRFAFEFIGVSNFIPLTKEGEQIYLQAGNAQIPWAGPVPEQLDFSKKVELGIRPNDIVFDLDSPIRGIVRRCVFLGSEYDYFVLLGEKELRVQQSTLDAMQYGVVKEGNEIGLRLLNPRYYES